MKNPILLFLFAIILMGLTTSNNKYDQTNGTIGDVKYSVLPEAEFRKNNPGWVLMDGRDVSSSKYTRVTGFNKIPDATGNFIRGMESGRTVGEYQPYTTAKPRYTDFEVHVYKSGSHSHFFEFGRSDKAAHSQMDKTRFIDLDRGNDGGRIWTNEEGSHSHDTFISGGDSETRPENIALYVYIKVN